MKKVGYLVRLLLITILCAATVYGLNCFVHDNNETGCTTGGNGTVCTWHGAPDNICEPKGCWNYNSSGSCTAAAALGAPCTWDGGGSFCQEINCFAYDETDANTCVNNSVGLSCEWFNTTGHEACDPAAIGCSNFDGQESSCINTFHCLWNSSDSTCGDPGHGHGENDAFAPGCAMIPHEGLCTNMTAQGQKCTWTNGACTGVIEGLACTDINDSDLCNAVPMFATCCAWAGGACNTTFSTSCWDNMQAPPEGADFCEDYNAVKNQTICTQIAGSPWFMPCTWDNQSTSNTGDDKCEFDGDNFFTGDTSHFEDIGSKSSCEAAGGIWKTESYVTPAGLTQNENWCEMSFGVGTESCDSTCWGCEFAPGGANWPNEAAAEGACEGSSLGYCQWRTKRSTENPPNGYGFCEKPDALLHAGCGVQTNCEDYKFYTDPATSCNNDEDCRWIIDPDDATLGSCVGANTKTCEQSCGQCLSTTACINNGTNCQWDEVNNLCKGSSSGGSSISTEICFNGIDDDADSMIDCADSGCIADPFCGGGSGVNCFQYTTNSSCFDDSGGSCAWINDTHTGQQWCDQIGANCWLFDSDNNSCAAEPGCNWITETFGGGALCDVNHTFFQGCFAHNDNTSCNADSNCTWNADPFGGGFCDARPFSCFSYQDSVSCATDSTHCTWVEDPHDPHGQGGRCEALCFTANASTCSATAICEPKEGICEPSSFKGGGCFQFDGNMTGCNNLAKCMWVDDPNFDNTSQGLPDQGWCDDAFMHEQFQGMEGGPPAIISNDVHGCGSGSPDASIPVASDICGLGIKDMENAFGIGVQVFNIENTMLCYNRPVSTLGGSPGPGGDTASVYFYLDSDDDSTNNCDSHDSNSSGFEFFFKYETYNDSGTLAETKLAYQCLSGNWSPVPIAVNSWPEKTCGEIGAIVVAVDKQSLQSNTLFNKSANLRFYATSSNVTANESNPLDNTGPDYYTQGSVDFIAEDCQGTTDMDGDGCLPEEDPDCAIFRQFGYIPFEDCYNSIDDNFDGNVDCDDPQCKYDTFACGGSLEVDPNDAEPPALAWYEVDALPDGGLVDVNTYEPSNLSVMFYHNDSTCTTLNSTIIDDAYASWHHIAIDNFAGNSQALGYDLGTNESYYLKYSICDISGNCRTSACANFTTPASYDSCGRSCATYLDPMDFAPPAGTDDTDPLGHLTVRYDTDADGIYDINKSYGESSTQKTLNETRQVNIKIENPNSSTDWGIECINGTIPSSINFNASNLEINTSAGNGLVGMPTSEYTNSFITDFNCDAIRLTLPYNGTDLYHCTGITGTGSCSNVSNSTTKVNSTNTSNGFISVWDVDPDVLGFSYYQSGDVTITTSSSSTTSSGGGGGGSQRTYSFVAGTKATQIGIKKGDQAVIRVGKELHKLKTLKVTQKSVTVEISSDVQVVEIEVGDTKEVDVNLDGQMDLAIKLSYVSGGRKAFIHVTLLKNDKLAAFEIIDMIKDFFAGSSTLTAFAIIDIIRDFYA